MIGDRLGRGDRAPAGAVAIAVAALLVGTLTACGSDEKPSQGSSKPSAPQKGRTRGTSSSSTSSTAAGGTETTTTRTKGTPQVRGVTVLGAGKLDSPTVLAVRPGDDDHLYVADRPGTVLRLEVASDGALTPGEVLLDITDETTTDAERGLLGLAFSSDGSDVYVSSTDPDGNTRLASYAMAPDGNIDTSTQRVILTQDQPYANHNGGNVVLGPDGKLWFGFGDGGSGDDPENRAQDPDTVLGKIVRFSPGDDPEIVVSGLRNPWRFAFDTDGSLWIGDVGQGQWEEVDHLPADQIEGANLGWSAFEGSHPNENVEGEDRRGTDPVGPVFEYSHDSGDNCSITGGFVYRGSDIPDLVGDYVFADYCAGDLRAIRLHPDGTFEREFDLGVSVENPQSFGVDQDGELYVLSGSGPIVRLAPA